MMFQDTRFFLLVVETKRLEQYRPELLCPIKVSPSALIRQDNILSVSLSTKSAKDGTINSKCESYTEGFWVPATKSAKNENVHDLQPFE